MNALGLVWRRRPIAVIAVLAAITVAALSRHVLGFALPRLSEPSLVITGLVVVAWGALAALARARRVESLQREARALAVAARGFDARVEAWLVGSAGGELEAEALRQSILERHRALVAAVVATLEGREAAVDELVRAATRPGELVGHRGGELVAHLVALQREALAEAQLLGFLGDARALALDDALMTITAPRPLAAPSIGPWSVERGMAALTAAFAVLVVLGGAERLAAVVCGALAAKALILFEAWATRPIEASDDPRPRELAGR